MTEVAVMFSGGVDSSYLVTRLDGQYDRIRLVTFDVPYSIRKRTPTASAEQLARICQRSEVTHEYLDMNQAARRIRGGLIQAEIDNRKVGHAYSWCLGCKLSMYARMVTYAREHGITDVADGAKGNDLHAAEQSPEAVALIDEMFVRYGLKHASPVYDEYEAPTEGYWARRLKLDDDNAMGRRRLKELGFHLPPQIFNQDRLVQPFCGVALMLNILRLVRRERPGATTRYYRMKEPLIDEVISEGLS
jgi:7-cyano-7-deazaguanine synthase in queuosine biosynthesis